MYNSYSDDYASVVFTDEESTDRYNIVDWSSCGHMFYQKKYQFCSPYVYNDKHAYWVYSDGDAGDYGNYAWTDSGGRSSPDIVVTDICVCGVYNDGSVNDDVVVWGSCGRKSYFNALRTSSTASTMHILWALMVTLATLASVCFGVPAGSISFQVNINFRSPDVHSVGGAYRVDDDGVVNIYLNVDINSCGINKNRYTKF